MKYLISDDLGYIPDYPFLYVRSQRTVILGDLHLGQQEAIVRSGTQHVSPGFLSIRDKLIDYLSLVDAKRVIFNGDIKHNTSHFSEQEEQEMRELLSTEALLSRELVIVRGNHDRLLQYSLGSLEFPPHWKVCDHLEMGGYLVFHGDQDLEIGDGIHTVILSHEHPVVKIGRTKIPAFVTMTLEIKGGIDCVVIPASGPYTIGVNFPVDTRERFLSPILVKYADPRGQKIIPIR